MKKGLTILLVLLMSQSSYGQRYLKNRVSIDPIGSRSFVIPGGKEFDFGFALNSQLMVELAKSPHFSASYQVGGVISNEPISIVPPTDMYGKEVPQCITDRKPLNIAGDVVSFELKSKNSITLGYNADGAHSGLGAEVNFEAEKFTLWLNLLAVRNNFGGSGDMIAGSQGEHSFGSRSSTIKINFNKFSISPHFFHQSSLGELTAKAAAKAIDSIAGQLHRLHDSGEEPWSTVVTRSVDGLITIGAGSSDGVKKGDRFRIVNIRHEWAGAPCQSKYDPLLMGDAAIVEVYELNQKTAQVTPLNGQYYNDVFVGDMVFIEQLR